MIRRILALALAASLHVVPLPAQQPPQLESFHDQFVALLKTLVTRPLTPGDTLLTFNPNPGGLTHTVRAEPGVVESSLLRADRMMGTARVEWAAGSVSRFAVLWTRADTLHGKGVDSAIVVHGYVERDTIRITAPDQRTLAVPRIPWAVADFGMEEQLIPVFRALRPDTVPHSVAVLRPYHLRWDTISVTVRDSASLRLAVTLGRDKAHEVWIMDQDGQLLYVRRMDQVGDRVPLPDSPRYTEMRRYIGVIQALLQPYPAPAPTH